MYVTTLCDNIYCADLSSLDFWTWQSNGKCTDHCNSQGTYAFAVIQYTDCWCTNYIPSTTTDISSCQKDCPGYPSEKCGDKDEGLYIYIELAGQPSGTAGGGSQPSSTVSSATPAPSSTDSPSSDATTVSTSISHCTASVRFYLHFLLSCVRLVCSVPCFVSSEDGHPGLYDVFGHGQHLTCRQPSSAQPTQRTTSRGRPPVTIIQTVVGEMSTITVTPTQRRTSAAPSSTTLVFSPVSFAYS